MNDSNDEHRGLVECLEFYWVAASAASPSRSVSRFRGGPSSRPASGSTPNKVRYECNADPPSASRIGPTLLDGSSDLIDDHIAASGTRRARAVKEDTKFVHDTGEAQKIPRHDGRLIGIWRCVRATEEIAREDVLGTVHADNLRADEPRSNLESDSVNVKEDGDFWNR